MSLTAPIRSRAVEEGSFEIPWWGIPLVLIVLYVCLFSGLSAIGLVGPDEPRYAAIARAMAETHDWVTPRLWGTPWFEKPVLYYWIAGIAMRLFGVSEFAARLPSALAGLLAVLAVAWTALRSYGIGAAWYSLLMLPTSVAMIGFSRAAGPDMLFAGLLTAAMAVAVEMLQTERPGPLLQVAFGFFLGAAVLAKGPAAVILAGGATLLWAAFTRQWRAPFRFLHPLVILAFCVTALPWYILCALRNPEFLRVFIWQHNFERYLTPVFQHPQPFWFYIPILALAVFPWIFVAILPFNTSVSESSWRDSPGLFILCWAALPFLFFSFSHSKLPGYVLPSIPAAFVLIGLAARQGLASSSRWSAISIGITGVALVLLPGSLALLQDEIDISRNLRDFHVIDLILVSLAGGALTIVFGAFKKTRPGLTCIVVTVALLVVIANRRVLPIIETRFSARVIAEDFMESNPAARSAAVFDLSRSWTYGLSYYFGRELPEWKPDTPQPEWLLTRKINSARFMDSGSFKMIGSSAPDVVLLHARFPNDSSR